MRSQVLGRGRPTRDMNSEKLGNFVLEKFNIFWPVEKMCHEREKEQKFIEIQIELLFHPNIESERVL